MKIKAIKQIQKFKSYELFNWDDIHDKEEDKFSKLNIFFGENGSGKSAICSIFKSLIKEQIKSKKNTKFELELRIKKEPIIIKYENKNWDSNIDKINKNYIVCFDNNFINNNIHVGKKRNTDKEGQEQTSAKLLVEFDAKAIKLYDTWIHLKEDHQTKTKELRQFEKETPCFKENYEEYFEMDKKTYEMQEEKLNKEIENYESKIKKLEVLNELEDLPLLDSELGLPYFSPFSSYEKLLKGINIKKLKISDTLESRFKQNRDFYSLGFDIWEHTMHQNSCPFCLTKKRNKVIRILKQIFDNLFNEKFKNKLAEWEDKKIKLTNELIKLQEWEKCTFKTHFDKNKSSFQRIKDLLKENWKVELRNYQIKGFNGSLIDKIYQILDNLTPMNIEITESQKTFLKKAHDDLKKEYLRIEKLIDKYTSFIEDKQKKLDKISDLIYEADEKISSLKEKIETIRIKKIFVQRVKFEELRKFGSFKKHDLERIKNKRDKAKIEYLKHCQSNLFQEHIKKMIEYFKEFSFDFNIELIERKRETVNIQYSYHVLEKKSKKTRSLDEGLSEGELQVLSLCFFLGYISLHKNNKKTILVFDDPITSLDDSNLNKLVRIIKKIKNNFSQVFIFTHHTPFFNFLIKNFGKKDRNVYSVFRNKNDRGGSFFIRTSLTTNNVKDRLENIVNSFKEQVINNKEDRNYDTLQIKYTHYLRYAIELLFKNSILHSELSNNFREQVKEFSKNKDKLNKKDLDDLRKIYSYCNWTASHANDDNLIGFTSLEESIKAFLKIYEKVHKENNHLKSKCNNI